ncbi:MAG: hypothetical protein IPN17_33340 [Deltaproteobacteria bacterium]|nr:hypothetical protein [Deltaproteobacteria bacterium]
MPIDPPELWDAPTRALLDARTRAVASPATPLARGARPEALGLRIAGSGTRSRPMRSEGPRRWSG